MKKILIICASFRKNGNSAMLAEEFKRGAIEIGNEVETVYLAYSSISFCKGCLACQKLHKCVINDDAIMIAEKMKNADVVVFSTPVYYYSISGQLKTMLDRANSLYCCDYKFRQVYLLLSAAEDEDETAKGSVSDIQGWVDCFEKARFSGTVFAGGVTNPGDIKGHKALAEAYTMGNSIKA